MENLVTFHDYGIDVENRIIYVGSDFFTSEEEGDNEDCGFNSRMLARFAKNLSTLSAISQQDIVIFLNNMGGDPYVSFAMYDLVKNCPCNVIMEVYGVVMSSASIFFQAADKRRMSKNSVMMIHFGEMGFELKHCKTALKEVEEDARVNKIMEDIYLERMNEKESLYTRSELQEMLEHDFYMTPEKAIELGLCDEII